MCFSAEGSKDKSDQKQASWKATLRHKLGINNSNNKTTYVFTLFFCLRVSFGLDWRLAARPRKTQGVEKIYVHNFQVWKCETLSVHVSCRENFENLEEGTRPDLSCWRQHIARMKATGGNHQPNPLVMFPAPWRSVMLEAQLVKTAWVRPVCSLCASTLLRSFCCRFEFESDCASILVFFFSFLRCMV